MQPGDAHRLEARPDPAAVSRYWRRTALITVALLLAWFGITFASAYFADQLNRFDFLGFPLGFYLCAQGNLLAYLLIVWVYAKLMNRLDERTRAGEFEQPDGGG